MLPTSERLRSNREFQQVYKEGKSYAEGPVVLYLVKTNDPAMRMAGFSVSKKIGNAVVRNGVKRRMRESYRAVLGALPKGYMAVFIARRSAAEADYDSIQAGVRGVLTRAGLLKADVV